MGSRLTDVDDEDQVGQKRPKQTMDPNLALMMHVASRLLGENPAYGYEGGQGGQGDQGGGGSGSYVYLANNYSDDTLLEETAKDKKEEMAKAKKEADMKRTEKDRKTQILRKVHEKLLREKCIKWGITIPDWDNWKDTKQGQRAIRLLFSILQDLASKTGNDKNFISENQPTGGFFGIYKVTLSQEFQTILDKSFMNSTTSLQGDQKRLKLSMVKAWATCGLKETKNADDSITFTYDEKLRMHHNKQQRSKPKTQLPSQ